MHYPKQFYNRKNSKNEFRIHEHTKRFYDNKKCSKKSITREFLQIQFKNTFVKKLLQLKLLAKIKESTKQSE